MLVLFDIDATLIKTSRAGLYAMQDGFKLLHGRECDLEGVQYAGCLDPVIFGIVLAKNGVEITHENIAAFRIEYRRNLSVRLQVQGTGYLLEGAETLVRRLSEVDSLTLGLLTGNWEDTGRMKLDVCGLDTTPFVVNAFGDASPHPEPLRSHLVEVAMQRYQLHFESSIAPEKVVVIGDSPHDVECAKTNGCVSLAVATGLHDTDTLHACGADLAVESLAETEFLFDWITQR
ncbi:MAG: phosphoglycolate phosphatase [Planctomycetota bacterium]|jgi:phosphoglycolate phosphatase